MTSWRRAWLWYRPRTGSLRLCCAFVVLVAWGSCAWAGPIFPSAGSYSVEVMAMAGSCGGPDGPHHTISSTDTGLVNAASAGSCLPLFGAGSGSASARATITPTLLTPLVGELAGFTGFVNYSLHAMATASGLDAEASAEATESDAFELIAPASFTGSSVNFQFDEDYTGSLCGSNASAVVSGVFQVDSQPIQELTDPLTGASCTPLEQVLMFADSVNVVGGVSDIIVETALMTVSVESGLLGGTSTADFSETGIGAVIVPPGWTVIAASDAAFAAPSPVPEPTSLVLLGTGLALGARQWRRRHTR